MVAKTGSRRSRKLPWEVFMGNLMNMEDREIKQGNVDSKPSNKIRDIRAKIADESYLEHAINRIATDLSHYLTK